MTNKQFLHAYDFMLAKGGAESVAIDLCENVQNMSLFTGFVEPKNYPDIESWRFSVKSLEYENRHPALNALLLSHAFNRCSRAYIDRFDSVLYSGSYAPLAVNQRSKNNNFYYCHTPPRFMYDLNEHYLSNMPLWQRPALKALVWHLKPFYESAIEKMDLIIANSKNVQQRINHYLGQSSTVVYPPCDLQRFKWIADDNFYLSTARLEPYKRVDLIVRAFLDMPDKKLIIASGGSQLDNLKQMAEGAANISFTGWCSDEKLNDLMGRCLATIYIPIDEDFGMSPVESMSAGKPVIGVAEGGVKETVIDEVTGVLLKSCPTQHDVIQGVTWLNQKRALSMKNDCKQRAKMFGKEQFFQQLRQVLEV